MAGRRNRNPNEPNWERWGKIAMGVAVGAAVGGGLIAMALANKDKEEDKEEERNRNQHQTVSRPTCTIREVREFIIAVDATPKRCGGLMRDISNKRIFYYSVDWTSHFSFSQQPEGQNPDRFEMINALVGMIAFEKHINRSQDNDIVCKTDNSFFNKTTAYKSNSEDTLLLQQVKQKLIDLGGEWQHALIKDDEDMGFANKLSRSRDTKICFGDYPGYYWIVDCSTKVRDTVLNQVARYVPQKYRV